MRRCGGPSSPAPAPALLLLLLICFFHCAAAAAARPLPAAAVPLQVHQENGVRVAADDEPAVLQKGSAGSGDGLSLSVSGVTGTEEDPAAECEEGNDGCLQRRLLRDAHLDYIYTQHKGKP